MAQDPVSIMQDIKISREKKILKKDPQKLAKETEKVAEEIKAAIKKHSSKRPSWEEFIQEIQCQY